MSGKISPALTDRLSRTTPTELVEIVLELIPPPPPVAAASPSRRDLVALKDAFAVESLPIEQIIDQVGGVVLERLWLNHTLKARVPAARLDQLVGSPRIVAIDVARPLTAE